MIPTNYYDSTAPFYDAVFDSWTSSESTLQELSFIKRHVTKDSKILDVGCGTGRHLVPLTKEGYNIIGIEPSAGLIAEIKKKSSQAQVFNGIFENYSPLKKFDLILLMYNVFCEIAFTEEAALQFLSECKSRLNKNGSIFLDIGALDKDNDTKGLEFKHSVQTPTHQIILEWKILRYLPETHTTECLETYSIRDLKTNKKKVVKDIAKQRWWKRKEMQRLADNLGMAMNVQVINTSSRHQTNIVILEAPTT